MSNLKEKLAYIAVFTLPLGFYGGVGVGLAALLALPPLSTYSRKDLHLILAGAPLSCSILLSTFLSPSETEWLPVLGTALLYLFGPIMAFKLAEHHNKTRLSIAFIAGGTVLAISVIIDFAMGWNTLPSGLFRDPSLHNWAATIIFYAFLLVPLMVERIFKSRLLTVLTPALLIAGMIVSLSWSIGFSLLLVFIFFSQSKFSLLFKSFFTLLFLIIFFISYSLDLTLIEIRGKSLETLKYIYNERFEIFNLALELHRQRPLLGWGKIENLQHHPIIINKNIALTNDNFINASEELNVLPWHSRNLTIKPNRLIAPAGHKSAELITGIRSGGRIFQTAYTNPTDVVTFSVWVKSKNEVATMGVSIRDINGTPQMIEYLSAPSANKLVGKTVAVFEVNENWQRIWIIAKSKNPINESWLCVVYFNDFLEGIDANKEFYIWGAQLVVGSTLTPYAQNSVNAINTPEHHVRHFHNYGLQTLIETGLLGLFLLCVIISYVYIKLKHSFAQQTLLLGLSTQMFDTSFVQSSIMFSFILIVTLTSHLDKEK